MDTDILGLSRLKALQVTENEYGDYKIMAEAAASPSFSCPECNDINADLPVVAANQACTTPQGEQNPPFCSAFINSPAGGSIELSASPSGYGSNASLWIGFIVWNQHLNLS